MNDIITHLLLFALISAVIVMMSAFFSEPDDGAALASFPKRFVYFVLGCGVLTGLMLIAEATLASAS